MIRAVLALTLVLALAPSASSAEEQNLYEWVAPIPVVVTAKHIDKDSHERNFIVEDVFRGDVASGTAIRVRLRKANRDRDRELDDKPLKLEEGLSYVLLLQPAPTKKIDAPPTFDLVRGVDGTHEVPAEGREAFVAAVERFIRIQDSKDEGVVWRDLTDMLEDRNPVLIETALEQFLKFRRGEPLLLGTLRPLLDHPSEELRKLAVGLIAQILIDDIGANDPIPDQVELRNELIARARRDSAIAVRIAAIEALSEMDWSIVEEVIEQIAEDDPDQTVRYTAETLMFDRQQQAEAAAQRARRRAGGS